MALSKMMNLKVDKMKRRKAIKTVVIAGIWICIGLVFEIIGPTLKDLKLKTNTNYEEVARAVSGLDIGGFIGAVLGGVLVDRFYGYWDLITAVFLDISAVAIFFVPHTPNVTVLWFLFIIGGATVWVLNMSGQKAILQLWQEDSSSALHLVHWGFGVGSFLIPVISNPFLAVPAPTENILLPCNSTANESAGFLTSTSGYVDANGTTSASTLLEQNCTEISENHEITYLRESRIEYAYLISSATAILYSTSIFYYQFWGNKKLKLDAVTSLDSNPFKDEKGVKYVIKMVDPQTCLKNRRILSTFLLLFSFLFLFNIVGGERVYGRFVRSYAIDALRMSGDDASFLNTTFWVSFSLGRFLFFIVAKYINIRYVILLETLGALISSALFCIFGGYNETMIWVLTQPMGLFIGPLFPSCIGWANYHMTMTGVGLMFILIGGTLGGVVHMWVIGYFYEYFGPQSFQYHMLAYGIIVLVIAVILNISTRNLNKELLAERLQATNGVCVVEKEDEELDELQLESKKMMSVDM